MGDDMHIYESAENYLEAILALSEHGAVRSIDVAQQLSVSKTFLGLPMVNPWLYSMLYNGILCLLTENTVSFAPFFISTR